MRDGDHFEDEVGECGCNPVAGAYRSDNGRQGLMYGHRCTGRSPTTAAPDSASLAFPGMVAGEQPIDWLEYCLTKPGAWADEPWEGDLVVKVGSKIFAFLGSERPTAIGLKCGDREAADLWLDRYPGAVTKSPYIGAHGWNVFPIGGAVPGDELRELIDGSYELIVAKLPRRERP